MAREEPVPAKRSAAVIGFLPSSITAAAEAGGAGGDVALAVTALAGLRVLTPDPPVMVAALLLGAATGPCGVVAAAFLVSSAFGASSRDLAAADTSAGLATGTTLGA